MCDLINSDHHLHPILLIKFRVSFFFVTLNTYDQRSVYGIHCLFTCFPVLFQHLFIDDKIQRQNDENVFFLPFEHFSAVNLWLIRYALNFVDTDYCILLTFFSCSPDSKKGREYSKIGSDFFLSSWEPFLISKELRSILVISKLCVLHRITFVMSNRLRFKMNKLINKKIWLIIWSSSYSSGCRVFW